MYIKYDVEVSIVCKYVTYLYNIIFFSSLWLKEYNGKSKPNNN